MIAITINNNFLKLVSLEQRLFKKIPLSPSVIADYKITDQKGFVTLVEKALVGIELPSNEVVVGLNEGEGLADNYSQALEALGFKVRSFVPLALSLANLTHEKETPHLIVCMEDDELVFVLVNEGGKVIFSATYPTEHILEATTAVLEFAKEKHQTTNIKKLYVCGENTKQVAEELKKAGLLVEIIDIKPSEFVKPVSLLQLKDGGLVIRPEEDGQRKRFSFKNLRSKFSRVGGPNIRKFVIGLAFVNGLAIAIFLIVTVVLPRLKTEEAPPVTIPVVTTPVPEATESASLSTELDKSTFNIQVLNGRGTQGVAAKGQVKLEELGYTVTNIDNTIWSLYSVIKVKEGNEALLEALTADLGTDYEFGDSEVLETESEFDAVVVLGSR